MLYRLLFIILLLTFDCKLEDSIIPKTFSKQFFGEYLNLVILKFLSSSSNSTQSIQVELWSNPATWGGQKPKEGDIVTIPKGKHIFLDESTPNLGGLRIDGILEFQEKDLNLNTKWIALHGTLKIGSEDRKFSNKAIITLNDTDTNADIMNMGTRGIMVMDEGRLELYGSVPNFAWLKINASISNGAKELFTESSVNWKVGDEIVVSPTDYYEASNGNSITQKFSIESIENNHIKVGNSFRASRWGVLQYVTTTGMSLSSSNMVSPPVANTAEHTTPRVLDERASVGNLTRNILIQAPDDQVWKEQGFGVHIMIMGSKSKAFLDGVEIRRAGQLGRLRRYPFHWHLLSYNGSNRLADANDQFIKNSTIHSSMNRGIVIHGTNGVLVQNNILFDIKGHGIFTEDAVERRNRIEGNLVLHVRNPNLSPANALKQHEIGERGSSCFWISNPDNIIKNNLAADCGTNGFWLAFPTRPFGESRNVLSDDGSSFNPSRILFGVFDSNTAHSNRMEGIMLDNVENDEEGNVIPFQYISTTNGRNPEWPFNTARRFSLARYKVWKNGSNGIWDRGFWADNFEVVSADNCGRFFGGSGADGIIERSLVVGTSLNHLQNGTDRPTNADFAAGFSSSTPVAFATYHSSFDIRNNIVVNFSPVANQRSGAFSTDDYYVRPVDKGLVRNTNNLFIQTHSGVKLQAPFPYFRLASALYDPHGIWGPPNQYFVYDDTFLTYGKTISVVSPNTITSGGVSVPGPYYGFEGFVLNGVGDTPPQNQPYFDLMAIHVIRWNSTRTNQIASWSIPAAEPSWLLQHMRHFAVTPTPSNASIYELSFPGEANPTNFQVNVENMLNTSDTIVIGIQYSGILNPVVGLQSYSNFYPYTSVGTFELMRDSAGETFWRDSTNNRIWVKLRGGRWQYWTSNPSISTPSSDDLLYNTTQLRIFVP
jgi:hypothetical protein